MKTKNSNERFTDLYFRAVAVLLPLLVAAVSWGCVSTAPKTVHLGSVELASIATNGIVTVGNVELQPAKVGKAVRALAKYGGMEAIRQKPELRSYFRDASVAISVTLAQGNVTPDDVRAALGQVTADPLYLSATADAVELYADFYGDLVKRSLDGRSPYTVPVLIGLANGLLDASTATEPMANSQ